MAPSEGKFVQTSRRKSLNISFITAMCFFVVLATAPILSLHPLRLLSREFFMGAPSTSRCPIIVYNKQIKTGSTVISNVLYRTTEAYGCYNGGCKIHQLLMKGNASHVGARNGITFCCHAPEENKNIIPNLRVTHGKDLAYIASVREPIGWFKSVACFFYKLSVNSSLEWTDDEGFKTVIDWLLQPHRYQRLESGFFLSLGLRSNSTKSEMLDKLLQYDLIIDHARMNEGLEELGKLLGWKMLKPSKAKEQTYRGPLYNTYRANEIKQMTSAVAMLYRAATTIREAKYVRPKFVLEDVPKLTDA